MSNTGTKSAILLVYCKDQPGIVVSITDFIFKNDGNILTLDQHVDTEHQRFFLRVEWDLEKFALAEDSIGSAFESTAPGLACSGSCISPATYRALPCLYQNFHIAFTTYCHAMKLANGRPIYH